MNKLESPNIFFQKACTTFDNSYNS